MFPFMVHVERDEVQDHELIVGTGMRATRLRVANAYRVETDANMDRGHTHEFETWYCHDKPAADALAAEFATKLPGKRIYVLELKTITQSAATPPVVSKYTEKGLIPA